MSKLYATATSEKASKGQGGNKRVDVIYTDESGNEVINVYCQISGKGNQAFVIIAVAKKQIFMDWVDIKGKKQKDEIPCNHNRVDTICEGCGMVL